METQIQFTKFVQALKDAGASLGGATLLGDPQGTWRGLPRGVQVTCLRAHGILCDPADVQIRLGKVPDAPKSLESILVILTHPEAEAPAAIPLPEDEPEDADEFAPEAAPFPEDEPHAAPEDAPRSEPEAGPHAAPEDEMAPEATAEAGPEAPAPEEHDGEAPSWATPAAEGEPMPEPASEPLAADAPPAPEGGSVAEDALAASAQVWPPEGGEVQADAAVSVALVTTPEPPQDEAPIAAAAALAAVPEEQAQEAQEGGTLGALKGLFGRAIKKAAEVVSGAKPEVAVTEIPPVTQEGVEVVEVYPVQEPYAYVRILHDTIQHEHVYEVIEPQLTDREKNILDFIENTIIDVIEVGLSAQTKEQAAELLRKHVDEVIYDYSIVLSPIAREKVLYYILRDFLGFGKLDPIMRDEYIEDVSCDGPGVCIFLYHRKYESIKSTTVFEKDPELDSFVIKMAQRSGKHVSIADPLLDATLPDGSRLNATLSDEVTDGGSTFTIRKFREDPFTIPDLVRFGTMNEELLAYWWLAVQNGASAIYAGGTASGKTTSLNAILLFIPPQMKIVSIEDTREINLPHENWIAGVTRAGFGPRDNNGRQAGEIDMFSLLKAALRQRPEYILVGEVRGQEATALFQAMATGHTAYGTMHADSTEAVIHRLESEPISIPRSLLEALDIVSIQIQTRIGDKRVRRTKELVEIVGLDPHTREILTNQVFTWSPATDQFEFSGVSYVLERIQIERNMGESEMREEFDRRRRIIRWMVDNNVRALQDVGRIIATYYRDPEKVMALIEDGKTVAEVEVQAAAATTATAGPQALMLVDDPDAYDAGASDAYDDAPFADADEEERQDGP